MIALRRSYWSQLRIHRFLLTALVLTHAASVAVAMESDDFSAPSLDPAVWTFVNPFDDATLALTGTHLEIALPANGQTHDIWTYSNHVPRALQSVGDEDLHITARFDSKLTADFQSQGIVIQQDTDHVVRAEFHHWAGQTKVYVATIFGDTPTARAIHVVPITPPMSLDVQRIGDTWTVAYSVIGSGWTEAVTFVQPMTVTSAGVFAGNSGDTAHTAIIDYFFDADVPVVPEDGGLASVFVSTSGNGGVSKDPDLAGYTLGTDMSIEATAAPGWEFQQWNGDLSGLGNPAEFSIAGDIFATAQFVELSDVIPPTLSGVSAEPDTTTAIVSWTTDEAATSVVRFGPTASYGSETADGSLTTNHIVSVTGLAPDTLYHFQVESADGEGNTSTSGDFQFTTDAVIPTGLVSDDFYSATLDTDVWTFVNPLGDATVNMTGAEAQIVIPATGQTHDMWIGTMTSPRLMQSVADTDFEVEAKFASSVHSGFQAQGIIVEEDAANILRIEVHYYGGGTSLYVAAIRGDVVTTHAFQGVVLTTPMHLRVSRVGDDWTISHSNDGTAWNDVASFTEAMTVQSVGVHASNDQTTPHTVSVDYFFETAYPVSPEDGGMVSLLVDVAGNGSIMRTPDLPGYQAGSEVTVEATPAPGWEFVQWGGDLAGAPNPASITLQADSYATAEFSQVADVLPPVISGVSVVPGATTATISWTTDEPATSVVNYGLTAEHSDTTSDGTLVTNHSVTLTGLSPGTTYHFEISSADGDGNFATTADDEFDTTAPAAATVVSDDFSSVDLDTGTWTYTDPIGDASLSMSGAELQISLPPSGVPHDLWTGSYNVPRVTQPIADGDFELEVKFDSPLTNDYQSQGVVVEQDDLNFLRIEFHYYAGQQNLFVASILGDSSQSHTFSPLAVAPPMYLRVGRSVDTWTVQHSGNGVDWTVGATFTQALDVSAVGVYAGNGNGISHTAVVDYFFDTSAPIIPEDGTMASIFIGVIGTGSVTLDPDQPQYAAGDPVEITAVADPGWQFDHWTGDLSGLSNPANIVVNDDIVANAVFIDVSDVDPPELSAIASLVSSNSATITWTTNEPASSVVQYGLTTSYADTISDPTLRTSHSVTIPGLASDAMYHFAVSSVDGNGNQSDSADQTFTTLPNAGPGITLWFGDEQTFGEPGVAQRWVNILGNVSDPDGIDTLTFRLNNGPVSSLSVGPDTRRLLKPGDFNVELLADDLSPGVNEVEITAFDLAGAESTKLVTVNYVAPSVWPETVSIDWNEVSVLTDVIQIVDGEWAIDNGHLRNTALGYDRVVAVGDRLWDDYEVVAELTMLAIDPTGYEWPSVSPGFGMTLRWPGHTAWDDAQPTWGWTPTGATVWYDAGTGAGLSLGGDNGLSVQDPDRVLNYDVTYVFKMRVETMPGQGALYSAKVWEKGQPEPAAWDYTGLEGPADEPSGSCIIIAHHVDVLVGPLSVVPLADPNPPVISDISINATDTEATISWTTNEPATSTVAYGTTSAYGDGEMTDSTLTVSHTVTLSGLTTGAAYHAQIRSTDAYGNESASSDLEFTAVTDNAPPVITNVTVASGATSAIISWTTDEPATSSVNYGLSNAYGASAGSGSMVTNHEVLLSALDNDSTYHFEIVSVDLSGNVGATADQTFSTQPAGPVSIASDDFSQPVLDTDRWTVVDPLGDATISMTGTQVVIDIPASGAAHDFWVGANTFSRIMQPIGDGDFEIEAKFESDVATHFQSQGLLIEQDPLHAVRVDFHNWGGQKKLFVATIFGSSANVRASINMNVSPPMYLRVRREGSTWTVQYSLDDATWTLAASFPQPMIVTAVGVCAGNSASTPHTAIFDYFFDTANPIDPEDSGLPGVSVTTVGQGSVLKTPDQAAYEVGTQVELTALPAEGWEFESWSGDLAGQPNPTTITVFEDVVGQAVFYQTSDVTAPVISNVTVNVTETEAAISWTTDEAADSLIEYGLNVPYSDSLADPSLVVNHAQTITGLSPGTTYHYRITSDDAAGNSAFTGDLIFTTASIVTADIISDEFDGASLDTDVWAFENPLGDAAVALTGTALEIQVPANGQEPHDVWTSSNTLPRIMQPINDANFEVELKLDSAVTTHFQNQGILVEQSPLDVVRVEFHNHSGITKLFAATIFNGSANIRTIQNVAVAVPSYLRLRRDGNFWVVSYSADGTNWTVGVTFNQTMTANRIGVFGGNSADTPHTAVIDYFREVSDPSGSQLFVPAGKRTSTASRALSKTR